MFCLETFDPRTKMMIMLCLSTYAMVVKDLAGLAVALLITLLILFFGGSDKPGVFHQARLATGMVLFIFLVQCISVRSGTPIFSVAGFPIITVSGLSLSAMLSLRLMILIMSAMILLNGEPRDYLLAMATCRVPYEIAFMVMTGIHFFPLIREEALNIYYSVQLRGTEIEKAPLRKKMDAYLKICLPILVCAMEKAKTMTIAMETRCFRVYPYRTYMRRLVLARKDVFALIFLPLATLIGILWFRI